jgi:hypothetical protein
MLLFIEFKTALPSGDKARSDVIAQVIAEADGVNSFNMTCELDDFPIHCILTDGKTFEFFTCDFKEWRLQRGLGTVEEGVLWATDWRITLPGSERDPSYLGQLKIIVELFLDVFIESYLNGVRAEREFSERRARRVTTMTGSGYRPRHSTTYWLDAEFSATNALEMLRRAHHHRVVDPEIADTMAEQGISLLRKSCLAIPAADKDWSFLDGWEDRKLALMRL